MLFNDELNKSSSSRYGAYLFQKQIFVHPDKKDYGYIEYMQKATEGSSDPTFKKVMTQIKYFEAIRDYGTSSLKPIKHLIQMDKTPNLNLMEPKWELYKISVSFQPKSKFLCCISNA